MLGISGILYTNCKNQVDGSGIRPISTLQYIFPCNQIYEIIGISNRLQAGRAILEAIRNILLFISDRLNGSVLTVEESVMIAFIKIYNKILPPIFRNKLNGNNR